MANVPIPPTFADPVVVDRAHPKGYFNPIWLKWFLDFAAILENTPITTNHEGLAGLLGGSAGQHYHFTSAEHTALQALLAGIPGRLLAVRILSAGTYTPTAGTNAVWVKMVAGGGAGGGAAATGVGQFAAGSGGGAGGYAESYLTTGFSGVTVAIGAGGTPGAAGAAGGNGGNSTFGALITCTGGPGGAAGAATAAITITPAATPVTATGGNLVNAQGGAGGYGLVAPTTTAQSGYGGMSAFGGGARSVGANVGQAATSLGSGGGGAANIASTAATAGGAGAAGLCIVFEYS